jgi:hypothetical protein
MGMQKHTVESECPHTLVELKIPVARVARNRVTHVSGVDTNLVCPACWNTDLYKCRSLAAELDNAKLALRDLAIRGDTHDRAGTTVALR